MLTDPSGIVHFYGRDYNSILHRFLNQDPIGEAGGINLYAYVGNNPISRIDPYGLDWGDWWDPRTWFNSGFTESWSDSAYSIVQALGGVLAGNWDQVADAYDSGVLGQTKDADPVTKYGTRAAIGTATVCVSAAVTINAAGLSTKVALHGPYHEFGPLGRLPHVQVNWWQAGVKGSGGALANSCSSRNSRFPAMTITSATQLGDLLNLVHGRWFNAEQIIFDKEQKTVALHLEEKEEEALQKFKEWTPVTHQERGSPGHQ